MSEPNEEACCHWLICYSANRSGSLAEKRFRDYHILETHTIQLQEENSILSDFTWQTLHAGNDIVRNM